MSLGLVGRKCGMTRLFKEDGSAVPVSVVHVEPNRVVSLKTVENDGYSAIQITTGSKKRSRLSKPEAGQFAKAGVEAGRGLWEFRVADDALDQFKVGQDLGVDTFAAGQFVDVQGTSIGKGFAGVVKRHHFRTQDATHGNSLSHRAPGSIGQNQTPGRVFKGKKMAGHLGAATRTTQSLEVVAVDTAKSVLLIKGSIPGAKGGDVIVTPGTKK
ncbi:MAG: 50S ribosomal protein L3 [Methylococcaceae bacterium]|nr:50S ribosomal protein L3 [Methylococcaceae bacterium]